MKLFVTIAAATALIAGSAMAQSNTPIGSPKNETMKEQAAPYVGDRTKAVDQKSTTRQSGPATINNAPIGSPAQAADQEMKAGRSGDSTQSRPMAPTGQQQSGPATINNAPVGSVQQRADQEKNAPRTGDSSKTVPQR